MQNSKKIVAMVLVGNILESYDYSLYGFFAATFAQLFFPNLNPFMGILTAFTLFAVGFLTRPIGGMIFGYFGDKYGRKKTLMISIMLMAIPTTLIGLLPTYQQVGIYAAIALALCRLIQGLAVGAEYIGSMIYMTEYAPRNKKNFYGSLCIASGFAASVFIFLFITLLTHYTSSDAMQSWGWRIPFLLGAVLAVIGFYVRSRLPETPPFKLLLEQKGAAANPFLQTIRQMPGTLVKAMGVVLMHVLGFYVVFVYMSSYLATYYKVPAETISLINTLSLLMGVITIPIVGIFAEKINKKYFIMLSTVCFISLSFPLIKSLEHAGFMQMLMVQSSLAIFLCMTSAVLPAFLSDLFPVKLRFTGMAITYNFAAVIFGGTAPMLLTYLVEKTHNIQAPAFYLIIAACICLMCLTSLMKKSNPLSDNADLHPLVTSKHTHSHDPLNS